MKSALVTYSLSFRLNFRDPDRLLGTWAPACLEPLDRSPGVAARPRAVSTSSTRGRQPPFSSLQTQCRGEMNGLEPGCPLHPSSRWQHFRKILLESRKGPEILPTATYKGIISFILNLWKKGIKNWTFAPHDREGETSSRDVC